jgi:peptidoglycan hydrolase CwlO-like protein
MRRQTLLNWLIFLVMIFVISACGGTKLLDIEETSSVLDLSETQRRVVQSKVQQIEEIVEDYELEKETLEAEFAERRNQMRSGSSFGGRGRGGMRGGSQNQMQTFYQQHAALQKQIDTLVAEIHGVLNEEQQQKFADIKLPELKLPEMGRRGGFGGGRRRSGGQGGFGGLGG